MKDAAPFLALPCIFLVIIACVFSNLYGYDKGFDKMKEVAIREGHAEWVADATGKPQFKWKECK